MYERLGFKAVDGFEVEIPAVGMISGEDEGKAEGEKTTYREVCMVYYPKGATKAGISEVEALCNFR